MELFEKEMERTRDRYNLCRAHGNLPYNMVAYTGHIKWIRNLYERIHEPMQVFKKQEKVHMHMFM